ncbi:MAG: hypothetical protein INR64_10250 [Caulobacteraceae bacterium]|nr:hypothetical protein [Caulobacter sp.]
MPLRPRIGRLLAVAAAAPCLAAAPLEARWSLGGEPLVIASRPQDAGAISSLLFRGREFIASRYNGWLLQGAGGYGWWAECLNPTLAGARYDPPGQTSSRLLEARADARSYHTRTRMAFWTPPGRRCSDAFGVRRIAANTTALSDTYYAQTLTPGFKGIARALDDHVVITTPRAARVAGFEVLTGYMPPAFGSFYSYDAGRRRLVPLADRELTQERWAPEVVSTADGRFAMGIVAASPLADARYAAFRNAEVSKWSLVYHYVNGFAAGPHRYECVVLLGTRDEVAADLGTILRGQARSRALHVAGVLAAAATAAALALAIVRLRARGPLRRLA